MAKENYQQAIDYCFRLLAKKNYSEKEIRDRVEKYLKKREVKEFAEIIEKAINRLKELQYIDDDKLVEHFANYRIKFNPCGKRQMAILLKQKGVDEVRITKGLDRVEIDEIEMATAVAEKRKNKWLDSENQINRQKLYGLLARRGFNLDTIYKVIDYCYNHISK